MKSFAAKIVWLSVVTCVVAEQSSSKNIKAPRSSQIERSAVKACRDYTNLRLNYTVGRDGNQQEFPWVAALGYINYENYSITFNCGGTLISNLYVLTTEHCVVRPQVAIVRLGIHKPTNEDGFNEQTYNVKSVHRHPDSSFLSQLNDIALVRVGRIIEFNANVYPICLWTNLSDRDPDSELLVTDYEYGSNGLESAHAQTMPLAMCNITLTEYNKKVNLTQLRNGLRQSQYCAYDPQGVNENCKLGGGAPLQYISSEQTLPHIIGVSSFGIKCDLPMVYTRVAHYLDWIESIVWPK